MATLFDPVDERHSFNVVTSMDKQKPEQLGVYPEADKKDTSCTMVFANESGSIFFDEDCTKEVPAKDALYLFKTGVVCKKGTTLYAAKSCTEAGVIDFGL